jgi:uncharacterized damage-inducible protein DinB
MRDRVIRNIRSRFRSFAELASALSEEMLQANVTAPRNKSLKEHFWCIVGARESYTNALEAGTWSGFNCSLQTINTVEVADKLAASSGQFDHVLDNIKEWTSERDGFLADLMEHEVMHEGQIIRHMYALGYVIPDSWKWA